MNTATLEVPAKAVETAVDTSTAVTVYVTIGNSDNKLTQAEWSDFVYAVGVEVELTAEDWEIYGEWHSLGNSQYQNAVFSAPIPEDRLDDLRLNLRELARRFKQDSIAFAVAKSELLEAATVESDGPEYDGPTP